GNDPLCVGVPDSSPAVVSVRPVGSVPVNVIVGAGKLLVVIEKALRTLSVKFAVFALVNAPASLTVSVKLCVAAAPTPLVAVIVSACTPPVPAAGVPPIVAVPSPLSWKNIPLGTA